MAYAVDEVTNAFEVTKDFLLPFGLYRWFKLAVIAFFVGSAGIQTNYFPFNSFGGGTPSNGFEGPSMGLPGLPELTIILLIVGIIVFLALIFLLLSSIFEFILVESLRSGDVEIRNYWSRYWRKGVRLFIFQFFIGFIPAIIAVIAGLSVLFPFLSGGSPFISIGLLLVLVPIFIVIAIVFGVIGGFTNSFVVPTMMLEDCGVLDGWGRFYSTLKSEWKEYLVYLILSWILGLVAGILTGIVFLLCLVVLLIPFGVLGVIGFTLMLAIEPLGIAILAIVVVLFILSVFVVSAFIQVPVLVYLRYYALLVLGDTDKQLDIIPTQRKSIEE